MPRRKSSSTHTWVYVIWGVNLAVVICLLGTGMFYLNSQRASAANALAETPRTISTQNIPPTSYFLPTLTPNPFSRMNGVDVLNVGTVENGLGVSVGRK